MQMPSHCGGTQIDHADMTTALTVFGVRAPGGAPVFCYAFLRPVRGMGDYKDVFWSGGRIVWRNLLRHYLLCLLKTTAVCLMAGPDFDRAILKTMIFSAYQDLPETRVRAIYQRACEAFIADSNIQND